MVKANEVIVNLSNADLNKVVEVLKDFDIKDISAYGVGGYSRELAVFKEDEPDSPDPEVEEDKGLKLADEEVPEEELPFEKNVEETETETETEDEEEVGEEVEEEKSEGLPSGTDYASMPISDLRDEIERRGLGTKSIKKQPLVDALIEDDKKGKSSEEIAEADDTEETDGSKYDGIKAPILYKQAQDRGLDVKPKQKAQVYIDLLEELDAKELAAKDEADELDDEWNEIVNDPDEWDLVEEDEEVEEVEEVEDEDDEDEDDEWDI